MILGARGIVVVGVSFFRQRSGTRTDVCVITACLVEGKIFLEQRDVGERTPPSWMISSAKLSPSTQKYEKENLQQNTTRSNLTFQ
jgi:hypothetical protein